MIRGTNYSMHDYSVNRVYCRHELYSIGLIEGGYGHSSMCE